MTIGTYIALDLIGSGILLLGFLIGVRAERLGLTSYLRSKFQRRTYEYRDVEGFRYEDEA
jgi:hypothetical protein